MDKYYIIVLFLDNIPYFLQLGNFVAWNFQNPIKKYKSLDNAKNRAKTLSFAYKNDKTYVFEIVLNEEISVDIVKTWVNDDKRIAFSLEKKAIA